MRAIVIREPGGPEVLEMLDVADPSVPFGHVCVQVRVAGINRADLLQRAGHYPAPPGVPKDIPGLEYAGVIAAVGEGTSRFSVGQRVFGLVAGGACAEKLVAHEREVVPIPEGLSDLEAAATPEAFVTAFDALVVRGHLAPGERVLVHAAGSGVGTAAIQVARAIGCMVIGTSRTADKLDRACGFGLTHGIVPEQVPVREGSAQRVGVFAEQVLSVTGRRGVDVVLDLVGAAYFRDSLECLAPLGRMVLVGLSAGVKAEIALGEVLRKRLTLVGTVLRARPLEEKIEAARLLEQNLSPWLTERRVHAVVDRVFPFGRAREAHEYLAGNASFGKVLLAVDADAMPRS